MSTEVRLQTLYRMCKVAFRGPSQPPRPEALEAVREAIERLTAADLNLEVPDEAPRGFNFFGLRSVLSRSRDSVFSDSPPTRTAPITCMNLHESKNFTIAVFCLPANTSIPLHDHPGMVVMSKVLYGRLHVQAYDWLDDGVTTPVGYGSSSMGAPAPRLASCVQDTEIAGPSNVVTLFPSTGGNLHSFTATSQCAVLDVLAPPYDPKGGRDCNYFTESRQSGLGDPGCGVTYLEEFEPDDSFVIRRGQYSGPKVISEQEDEDDDISRNY